MEMEQLYAHYLAHPSVQTDTRKLKKGDIFFALKGPHFNGNLFAKKALDDGASLAVIDEEAYAIAGKTMLVEDALIALQQLALHHRKQFEIPFLAITGSNGKTTTKELIHAVLSTTFKTFTTEGNLNNHIGVPLTILSIAPGAEMAVIEMGANHIGEIASYCNIALPTHGIITNCGKAHLEGFGSEEGVRKAKGELYDHLRSKPEGFAFVNWDELYLRDMSKGISGIIKYGTGSEAHVIGRVSKNDPLLEVELLQGMDEKNIATQLVGEYNLPNVLAAVTVGKYFKVPEKTIVAAIENYAPSNSRSQLMKIGSNQVILDAYNANPSSMNLAISNFAKIDGKKILVLGSMAELGAASAEEHQALIEQIKKYTWDDVALVGNEFKNTGHPFHQFESAEEVGEWLSGKNIKDMHVLVKGSRSMMMEKAVEGIKKK